MTNVYVVHHVHSFPTGLDNVKLIGVYSSRANAEAAVTRVGQAPGFAAAPEGFHIEEYAVDVDHWGEGYVTL